METPQAGMDRAINFVFMARLNKKISIAAMQDALTRLRGRHHALEVGNRRNIRNWPPHGSKVFPVAERSVHEKKTWQEIAASEMDMLFPIEGPYVRVNLLHAAAQTDLILAFDHQVCDGMSAILFLRDLVFLLNHPQEKLAALPVQPAIWEIIPEKAARDWPGKLRIAFFMKFIDFSAWRNRNKPAARFDPRYRVDSFEMDKPLSQALIARCRREKTSVHAAISVAWMMALQSMFNESGEADRAMRSVSSPVSIRHLLPDDKKACAGMYYSTITIRLDCNHSHDFWEAARQVKNQMDTECKKDSFYDIPRFFRAMFQRQSELAAGETFKTPALPVDYDFSISNMGKLDAWFDNENGNPNYKVEAIYGPIVNAFKGEKTVGVCTLHGKINFVFTTFDGDMDITFIHTLIAKVRERLNIAIKMDDLYVEAL